MRRASAVLLAIVVCSTTACGGGKKTAGPTTTVAVTTTEAPTTTIDPARLRSTSSVAVALNTSILTATEIKAALGVGATPVPYTGMPGSPPPPVGPLSLDGVVAVFPSPVYSNPLQQGKASVGANQSYAVPAPRAIVDILAIKFESAATAAQFVQFATNIAVQVAAAKQTAHPEVTVGVSPSIVLRVPPQPGDNPPQELIVTAALYQNGVYYVVSEAAAPGTVPDSAVIGLLRAQDRKFQAKRATLGLS